MTDTSKRAVEQKICLPIIALQSDRANISDTSAEQVVKMIRAIVQERDTMSTALAFLASRAEDLSKDAIERIARQALDNK